MDNQGNSVALSNIDFYFDGEYLVGMVFAYGQTALQRSIGICEGTSACMSLARGEEVVAIDMLIAVRQFEGSIVVVSELLILARQFLCHHHYDHRFCSRNGEAS